MKKTEIIKANSILMVAIMFIDLDSTSETGHPRSKPVRDKITKILETFRTHKNRGLNIRANALAQKTLETVQEQIQGEVEVNLIAMILLSTLEDTFKSMPKLYNLPSEYIIECINTLADICDVEMMNRSSDTAEYMIKEVYDS